MSEKTKGKPNNQGSVITSNNLSVSKRNLIYLVICLFALYAIYSISLSAYSVFSARSTLPSSIEVKEKAESTSPSLDDKKKFALIIAEGGEILDEFSGPADLDGFIIQRKENEEAKLLIWVTDELYAVYGSVIIPSMEDESGIRNISTEVTESYGIPSMRIQLIKQRVKEPEPQGEDADAQKLSLSKDVPLELKPSTCYCMVSQTPC